MRVFRREVFAAIRDAIASPRLVIDCFGDQQARNTWRMFNARHPKFPLMRRKTFGAAMRNIPAKDQILEGSHLSTTRRAVRKALKAGYTFKPINPNDNFEPIMAVNLSSGERQGRAIATNYTDRQLVKAYHGQTGDWYGVFDKDDVLQAYTHVPIFGDSFVFSRILGNSERLGDGIMHLIVAETLREMGEKRDKTGYPNWAMYDMLIGAGAGLREFKRRTGFEPRRVKWHWVDK